MNRYGNRTTLRTRHRQRRPIDTLCGYDMTRCGTLKLGRIYEFLRLSWSTRNSFACARLLEHIARTVPRCTPATYVECRVARGPRRCKKCCMSAVGRSAPCINLNVARYTTKLGALGWHCFAGAFRTSVVFSASGVRSNGVATSPLSRGAPACRYTSRCTVTNRLAPTDALKTYTSIPGTW